MRRNKYYFVKIRGSYVNYLNLFSETPIRLKNTTSEKEAIIYTAADVKRIMMFHSDSEIEIQKKY